MMFVTSRDTVRSVGNLIKFPVNDNIIKVSTDETFWCAHSKFQDKISPLYDSLLIFHRLIS